jgi:hypothetical protein
MSKAKIITTLFIIEVEHKGIEYHVTITDDLKTIYDVDVVNYPKGINPLDLEVLKETEMIELIFDLYMKHGL